MRIASSRQATALVMVLVALDCGWGADPIIEHPPQRPQVLNNFVTQLVTAESLSGDATHTFTVENPRNGWLFFRSQALVGRTGELQLGIQRVDDSDQPLATVISCPPGDKRIAETMRFLAQGSYRVQLKMSDAEVTRLDVRRIPMIIYERVPGGFRAMTGFPEYDQSFLQSCGMLDSVNTIGTYDGFRWMSRWQREGRRAIRISGGIGGLNTEQKAFNHWDSSTVNPGGVDGMIIDEVYPNLKRNFPHWVRALKRVRQKHPDKLCLIYTAGGADSLRDVIEPLSQLDIYWTPEEQVYESHLTHEEVVASGFGRNWIAGFQKEGYFANISARTVHSIGIFSGPSGSKYNDDVYPDRSWKVLRELHFHELATHPLHRANAGVDLYQSTMCQEEHLRWMARLCRHYCIEGNTSRLTDDRYELNHIQNPDFEHGLEGWTLEPAEPGGITVRHLKGYGLRVQGRHGHAGDHLLCMKRSADKPNIVRQQIQHLEPGRHYSVTLYSGDYTDPHEWQLHQIGLLVRGDVREEPSQTIHNAWRHDPDSEFGSKQTFPNYHRIVFQANQNTAELIISDWRHASTPTGQVGQQLMFNFVQVEPYLMPDRVTRF